MFKPLQALALTAFVALGSPLLADRITFNDGMEDVLRGNVVADSLRRVEWRGQVTGNTLPWNLRNFALERNRGAATLAFEAAWTAALRTGDFAENNPGSSQTKAIEDLKNALEVPVPAAYPDADPARLRILYYLFVATAAAEQDPADAFKAYMDANVTASKVLERNRYVPQSSRKPTVAALKDVDYAYLHSKTIDAYRLLGNYYARKGELEKAWTEGYDPAISLAEGARGAFNLDDYVTRYAVPILREAALVFTKAATPDFKKGAEIYNKLATIAQTIKDDANFNWARLMAARCSLQLGDNTAAERVYNQVLRPLEDGKRVANPQDRRFDWITPDKATAYAQALVGRGLIAAKANRDMDALKHFTEALAFYSADRQARAEALFEAAKVNIKMAKVPNARQDYYRKTAEAYHLELSLVLSDTEFGQRQSELKDAIRAIGKN